MNKIILAFTFFNLFFFNSIFAQINKNNTENIQVVINPDAFLLGTFSEHLTRFYLIDKETQIDNYKPEEKSLAKYISFFIKQNYKLDANFIEKDNGQFEILLPELAQRLHATYYSNQGQIIAEKLNSDAKKHSYLLGIFYRYGSNLEGNYYQITINNSSKQNAIIDVLKDIDVRKIVFHATQGLPRVYTFTFEATPKLMKYFDYIKQEKTQLDFSTNSINTINELNDKSNDSQKKKSKKKKEFIKNLDVIFE